MTLPRLFIVASLASAGSLSGCDGPDHGGSRLKNVFGQDQRTEVTAPERPLTALGRLDSGCTGVRVAPELVLTAAHCVVDDDGRAKPMGFVFRQDFAGGLARQSYAVARAWYGTNAPSEHRERDFAVLRLASGGADAAATLPIDARALVDAASLPRTVSLAGFSVDRGAGRVLSVHKDCSVRVKSGDRYLHDCDAGAGISGAPLLSGADAGASIVGLAVSEYRNGAQGSVHRDDYSDDYANVAIAATGFAPLVARLVQFAAEGGNEPVLEQVYALDNPTPVDDRPGNEQLNDYTWRILRAGVVRTTPGSNTFDVALAGSQRFNPLRASFGPGDCGRLEGLKIAAITVPEGDVWEAGAMFAGEAARFTNGGIRFVRIAFESNHAERRDCKFTLQGADDRTTAALPTPAVDGRTWRCTATPRGKNPGAASSWTERSVDFARSQALAACTFAHGLACAVACVAAP